MMSNTVAAMHDVVELCFVGFSIQIEWAAVTESVALFTYCRAVHLSEHCQPSRRMHARIKNCKNFFQTSQNHFVSQLTYMYATNNMPWLDWALYGGGEGGCKQAAFMSWPCCFSIDHVSSSVQVQAKDLVSWDPTLSRSTLLKSTFTRSTLTRSIFPRSTKIFLKRWPNNMNCWMVAPM